MRQYLFRGKRLTNGEWVYGSYVYQYGANTIYFPSGENGFDWCHIDPETVGQYTGLHDKNGKRIFEGDIIRSCNGKHEAITVIKYGDYRPNMIFGMFAFFGHEPKQSAYGLYCEGEEQCMIFDSPKLLEVVGNIHDNPELLEVER